MEDLYLLFDSRGLPSDALESQLSKIEAVAAPLFDVLDTPSATLTDDQASHLLHFLALQACRHPDVINRAHERGRELAELLADAHSHSREEFAARMAAFGVSPTDADAQYKLLIQRSPEALFEEYEDVLSLSPQDPACQLRMARLKWITHDSEHTPPMFEAGFQAAHSSL